jgi:peptidoglycan/LPS O-acetylase OafA/YrhL
VVTNRFAWSSVDLHAVAQLMLKEPQFRPLPQRADIEGLRALAVAAVLLYHYKLGPFQGGFVGVDLFFVISGYLITSLLLKEYQLTGHIDFIQFYGRRCRRLLPAATVVTVLTLITSAILSSPLQQRMIAKAALSSALYASNFWFLKQTAGYFSPESAHNPFLHTWSLSVEEQFYLLWPALLLFFLRREANIERLRRLVFAACIGSFLVCLWLTYTRQPWAFYSSPSRAWEFGIGALVCLFPYGGANASFARAAAFGWLCLLGLVASLLINYDIGHFPAPGAVLAVASTTVLIWLKPDRIPGGPRVLYRNPAIQWLGARSYSVYLWHWPIWVYAVSLSANDDDLSIDLSTRLACIILTLGLAGLSYSLIEKPTRHHKSLQNKGQKSVVLGISLSGLSSAAAGLAMVFAVWALASPGQRDLLAASTQGSLVVQRDPGCLSGILVSEPKPCFFPTSADAGSIVLFGDSHADQWSTPLLAVATRNGWRLITLMKSSCSVADIPVYNIRLNRISPECAEWRSRSLQYISKLKPSVVIVAEFSSGYVSGHLNSMGTHAVNLDTWARGLEVTLGSLQKDAAHIILLRDSPTPGKDIPTCLSRANWTGRDIRTCDVAFSQAMDESVTHIETAISGRLDKIEYIDLTSRFCSRSNCPAVRDGTVIYRDAHHLSTNFALLLASDLEHALAPLITH